ncbi:uncharacterized protein LTR77_005771 [Saxophila tyrrhenica]|uniref:Autophagy-related protein n=1 Tax=Saxophila tyrrhenica TaxID=1690608 RepID=A0AAV9P9H1_9PEZI|nr:hypothetical protein LTR77_005771 [Saxophila tyrrhenica]
MLSRVQSWWKCDTALHGFVFANFVIGLPFTVFNTYTIYQLQTVGFVLGTDGNGGPCTTFCIVPWAGVDRDLNSIILYLNAIGFGVGGVVTLALSAYSDLWCMLAEPVRRQVSCAYNPPAKKHLLVTISIIAYGACSIPCYWLQNYTLAHFDTLTALWIIFAILTFIIIAVLNMYIPFCMRNSTASEQGDTMAGIPSLPSNLLRANRTVLQKR